MLKKAQINMLIYFNFVLHAVLTVQRENLWIHQKMHDFPTQNTWFHFFMQKTLEKNVST